MQTTNKLRTELEALPKRMQTLPVDERGYPVPWFVDWIDGKPEFRAMNPNKWQQAIRFKLCWVCGERLGRYMTFLAGPMCGINRTSSEPPCHLECAEWSARNCPFLNNPEAIRRTDEHIGPASKSVGGFSITRNPGVVMLWTCMNYNILQDGLGGYLLNMGEPYKVDWWAEGYPATREQVLQSIESGIPALENLAASEPGGLAHLQKCRERLERWLPKLNVMSAKP